MSQSMIGQPIASAVALELPAQALSEPESLYEAPSVADLSDKVYREKVSPTAAKAFLELMRIWKVRDADARQLLGGISNGGFYDLKSGKNRALDQDKLTRIAYLFAIFSALNTQFGQELADKWINLPNNMRLFSSLTPLAFMLSGGMPAFEAVRRLVNAQVQGF